MINGLKNKNDGALILRTDDRSVLGLCNCSVWALFQRKAFSFEGQIYFGARRSYPPVLQENLETLLA